MEYILVWGIPKGPEMILIVLVLLLLFGGSKIPQLMKGLGEGITEFKKGIKGTLDPKEEKK